MHRALVIALLAAIASALPAQEKSGGEIANVSPLVIGETFTISSAVLHEVRRINVYIPPGYTDTSAALPVLYMPDGGIKEDFLHIAGLVQISVDSYTMRPFLLVGIENTERRRDMTGPTEDPDDRKIAPHVGGSAAFRRFIRAELMPRIKARYRTTGETAVMGESLAGLFVVETLLREPDMFDSYIAFDPSVWWNKAELVPKAAGMLRSQALHKKTLYLANSSEPQLANLTARLAKSLDSAAVPGLELHYVPMPEETHRTIYHPAAIRALRTLFKPAQAK